MPILMSKLDRTIRGVLCDEGYKFKNRRIAPRHLKKIRELADFDLIMLISDIHDHGWAAASRTLDLMPTREDRETEAEAEGKT